VDVIASRVQGVVQARDCRVIWQDGHLYVCRSPTDIAVFACELPKKSGGMWRTTVGEDTIVFRPPGCGSCRARVLASPIGQMTREAIVASVASIGADA
jgi:hypothetical protein